MPSAPRRSAGSSAVRQEEVADLLDEPRSGGDRQRLARSLPWRLAAAEDDAPGLLDDEPTRGEVPRVESGLGIGVDGALRDPDEVERGAADAPDVSDERQDPQEHLGLPGPHLRVVAEARGQ